MKANPSGLVGLRSVKREKRRSWN